MWREEREEQAPKTPFRLIWRKKERSGTDTGTLATIEEEQGLFVKKKWTSVRPVPDESRTIKPFGVGGGGGGIKGE